MNSIREADSIEIRVLIDNVTDSSSSTPSFVTAEWDVLRAAGMSVLTGSCQCCASHGLSLLISARFGDEARTVLFDTGPAAEPLRYNLARLKVDLGTVEAIVLSHGHWDHAGGLIEALELVRRARQQPTAIPCYLHPGMFGQRGITRPLGGVLPIVPVSTPFELEQAGARPVVTTDPQQLMDGSFYLSGEIPRITSFERGLRGHVRRSDEDGTWKPDPLIMDERYLVVAIRGRGLLIFSACSHAGIVNVVLDARRQFPSMPIFGVLGGFHLSGGNEAVIAKTVTALADFNLQLIAPGHCTGWRAVSALSARFGEPMVVPTAVGQLLTLRASDRLADHGTLHEC